MKKLLKSGVAILIGIMVLYIIYLQQCRRPDYKTPDGFVLVSDSLWNIVTTIEHKSPVVIVDTITEKGETIYLTDTVLVPVVINDSVNFYTDSIVNDSIRIWDELYVQGIITKWDRRYEPIIVTIKKEITVTAPQIIERPVPKPSNGIFISGIAGGNANAFVFGAGVDLVTKKNNIYGFQYQRFGDQNFYSIRVGSKIRLRR